MDFVQIYDMDALIVAILFEAFSMILLIFYIKWHRLCGICDQVILAHNLIDTRQFLYISQKCVRKLACLILQSSESLVGSGIFHSLWNHQTLIIFLLCRLNFFHLLAFLFVIFCII